ncbi:hypothetical protein ACS127_07090 [Amphibacillus sp. Q70]
MEVIKQSKATLITTIINIIVVPIIISAVYLDHAFKSIGWT